MAATIVAYNDGKRSILDGDIDLVGDTLKVALCTSTYTPDIDADTAYGDISNELAASGNYSTGGETLTTVASVADDANDRGVLSADPLTWTALTASASFRYGVIYSSTGSELIAYIDFGADQQPGGSDFTITWHADGILYI